MKRLFMLLLIAMSLPVFAASPETPVIQFDTNADWWKTKGATFQTRDGVAVIDGTDWDSKIYRTVKLTPDTPYELTGTGRGKVMVRIGTFCTLNLSGDDWTGRSVKFRTPEGNGACTLVIQVNDAKGHAEIKSLLLKPLSEADFAAAEIPVIQFDANAGWRKTKGATFQTRDGVAVIDGTDWDSKIYKTVKLTPDTSYELTGTGRGKVMVRISGTGKEFCSLNLSGDDWETRSVKFRTQKGNEAGLVIQVNGAKGHAEVKSLIFKSAPETEKGIALDPAKLRANRPNPEIVRGFMIGNFNDDTAKTVREWGANVVRLQYNPIGFARSRGTDWETAWPEYLNKIEEDVKRAKANGLKVVIDMHGAPLETKEKSNFWKNPALETNFLKVWRDIATRLKPYAADTIWGYDLYNEPLDRNQLPHPPVEWRPLAIKILKAIREIDPNVWIIYEPGPGGGFAGDDMEPLPDYRVIYSTHFYTPHEYTHQGISNIEGTDLAQAHEKINVAYPGPIVVNGCEIQYDKARVEKGLEGIDRFLTKYPAPYYIGEFSVVCWAPGRDQYLRDVIELFEKRGWSWSYHAFREWQGWSPEYDGYTIENNRITPVKTGDSGRGQILREFFKR